MSSSEPLEDGHASGDTPSALEDSGPSSSDALLREVARAPDRALPAEDPRIGARLGRFRILERLGCGGMGIVYAARDEKLSRVVALKLLHADSTLDEHRRRRLAREARAASAISHPGIATVFDVGEIDGHVFVAMERVQGRTLRQRLGEGLLPVAEAVRLGTDIARALGAAHRAGIVHRDLKPDNVMIDDEGRIKILDFGLAKPLDSADKDEAASSVEQLTQEGKILGTPSYMSPEQATGVRVDERSDVFSLGVVLYEMIAGTRPFGGGTRMQTLVAVSRDRPEPLSKRRSGVPPALARIVERCLAKEPDARPASGEAVALELEHALERGPFTGRRVAAAVALVGAATLAWVLVSSRKPDAAPTVDASPPRPEAAAAAPSPNAEPPTTPEAPATAARPVVEEPQGTSRPKPSTRSTTARPTVAAPVPSAAASPATTASARAPRDPMGVQK